MKKINLLVALFAIATMTACHNDPDYNELIVGKWDLQKIHYIVDDHTNGTHNDYTDLTTDTNYVGYNTVEFNANGTTRWHMNDRYVQDGMYDYTYRDFNWYITGDSLIIWCENMDNRWFSFEIKELDRTSLVVEEYYNHPAEYSHPHLEGTDCYTFKRIQ